MTEERACANILVSGTVQGVFFRASTMEEAQQLRVHGWVQNLPDGRVEVMAEGLRSAVNDLILWIKKGGPPSARIEDVVVRWREFKGEFDTFRILS